MSNDQPHRDLGRDRLDDDLIAAVAASPELARVAFLLAAQPTQHELTGLQGTLREFRAHVSTRPQKRRRPSMISTLAGAKLGATIAGLAVGLGGAATVAYVSANTPATPDTHAAAAASPTQRATPTQAATGSAADKSEQAKGEQAKGEAVGPDATGSAGFGLCTAWKGVAQHGKAMEAVAFQNLIKAAGGKDKVEAFCAKVDAPGKSEDRATGKPADAPTGKPTDAPAGKPETAPTVPDRTPAAPTSHPTGRS